MRKLLRFLLLITVCVASAQQPAKSDAVEVYNKIRKLNFLGSVLYIAAHPDDENTRLISYFSNHYHARTGYLSLTRGDGGQNLVGPELRELLGVIRTQELLEARKVDGGIQMFSRANDFGFSKNPDETFNIWNRDEVLSDVVRAIRKFRPDVIINRFDHRSPGTTHGHHTASAMLSVDAFDLAASSSSYPNQLKTLKPWQPKRLLFNTSWWFYGSREKFENADKSNLLNLDIGVYYADKGMSNQEIAALSRSCHRSQGFGTTGTRGTDTEYLELLKGTMPSDKMNLFEGIDTSWNRVSGGAAIGADIDRILKNYDHSNPSASIPALLEVYQKILKIEDEHWRELKSAEAAQIIADCAGLYLEAVASSPDASPGSTISVAIEAINRSSAHVIVESVDLKPGSEKYLVNQELAKNSVTKADGKISLPANADYTSPYWLENPTVGMYPVSEESLINLPETPRKIVAVFRLKINNIPITYTREIVYKYNDGAKGEMYEPFDVVPDVSLSFADKVTVFTSSRAKKISVKVRASRNGVKGTVKLALPDGWKVTPAEAPFQLAKRNEEQTIQFMVSAPSQVSEVTAKVMASVDGRTFGLEKTDIKYEHIAKQTVLLPAKAKFIKPDLKTYNDKIAYIMGAGDEVDQSLRQMGYDVTLIRPENITKENLASYDVVITGIRAYNKISELGPKQKLLLDFVAAGGTMIVQYNTLDELTSKEMSPYQLKLSRDRVTDENAEIRFLAPSHKVLRSPNRITADDFKGWVQEIGLYFPSEWSPEFTPIISANDAGEKPKDGALLVAKYGKGHYIYTGISFFRQLPEGVSGAFRLMANLISIGH